MPHSRALFALSVALSAAACSSSSAPVNAAPDTAAGCATDPRVQAVAGSNAGSSGLTVTGAGKSLAISLVKLTPETVTKGVNDWTFELRDAAGRPLDGATITVVPYMPDHGHGASVAPTVTALGSGRYDVANLSLPMPGVWELTFDATVPSGVHDTIVITACVQS
jgi:hypothetical protein